MISEAWPTVAPDDDGIRPAGRPDECFYCSEKVGQPHGRECAVVTKVVRIAYTVEVDVVVPHFWTADNVEFHRNESSWCADNLMEELGELAERSDGGCLCDHTSAKFVRVVDATPVRKVRAAEVGH